MNRQELKDELPRSVRIELAQRHYESLREASKVTRYLGNHFDQAYHSFLAGFDAAAERACGELLAENQQLQEERLNISMGQRRIAGLERLFDAVLMQACEHPDKCDCEFCQIIRTIND